MTMDTERFREYLLIHGAGVHRWPEDVRQAGAEAVERSSECRSLQEEYARFEAALSARVYEEPSPDLARRIVSAARRRERNVSIGIIEFLVSCFRDLRVPAPVFTTAAVLVLGVVLGLWLPAESVVADPESSEAQTFLDSAMEGL
jgi:hypothetical protein